MALKLPILRSLTGKDKNEPSQQESLRKSADALGKKPYIKFEGSSGEEIQKLVEELQAHLLALENHSFL